MCEHKVLAFVPVRGGSKSIPLKNLAPICGVPMMDYAIAAASKSSHIDDLIVSSDDRRILDHARKLGLNVTPRPPSLAKDETPVIDVITHYLAEMDHDKQPLPAIIVLLQVTSPFLRPIDIDRVVTALKENPDAASAQTVAKPPHNFHAWNQRQIRNGNVDFHYAKERAIAHNKQLKPELFVFGNLVATRTSALMRGNSVFALPSLPIEINWPYYLDVDAPDDLKLAELLLGSGIVSEVTAK